MKKYYKSRRKFIKMATLGATGVLSGLPLPSFLAGCKRSNIHAALMKQAIEEGKLLPKPTDGQFTWQDCEVGLIYHFDMPVAAGRYEHANNDYREVFDPNLYNPAKLDTDQWIEAAKAAGAKYAIFTATHFNGFMQWQSELYPYGLKQARWLHGKGDIVDDFVNSCRKAGIRPGIYLSTHRNAYWKVWNYYVNWGKGKGTEKQEKFNRIAEEMVGELCSRYGQLVQIWFDGGTKTPQEGGPDVLPIFEKYQPDSVFYHSIQRSDHRWIGNESGYAGYPCWATMPGKSGQVSHNHPSWKKILGTGDPNGAVWSPGMVDVPLRGAKSIHNWFWKPNEDYAAHSRDNLIKMYYNSVGRNCNFIIGEVITPDGLVPETDIKRLKEFGKEVERIFSNPVIETKGVGKELKLDLPQPRKIDHLIIQEHIEHGERIRSYVIEGLVQGNTWQKLCDGVSVGHKRIQQFEPTEVTAVRLTITKAIAEPIIRKFALYHSTRRESEE